MFKPYEYVVYVAYYDKKYQRLILPPLEKEISRLL